MVLSSLSPQGLFGAASKKCGSPHVARWPDDRESLSSQNYVPHNRNKDTKWYQHVYIYIYMLVYHSQNLMPMRANPEKKALIASNRMSLPRFDSRWALGHSCLWQLSLLPLVSWVVAATTEALKVCTGSTSRVLRHGHIISSWKYRNMQNRIKHHQATSNTHITYTWYSA